METHNKHWYIFSDIVRQAVIILREKITEGDFSERRKFYKKKILLQSQNQLFHPKIPPKMIMLTVQNISK